MSAAALPAGTEQLAVVAALPQRSNDSRASRLGMPAVLFEHQRKVLSDELRTRDATLAGSPREQPIVLRIQGDGRRFRPRECHGSNVTRRARVVKPSPAALLLFARRHVDGRVRHRRWRTPHNRHTNSAVSISPGAATSGPSYAVTAERPALSAERNCRDRRQGGVVRRAELDRRSPAVRPDHTNRGGI